MPEARCGPTIAIPPGELLTFAVVGVETLGAPNDRRGEMDGVGGFQRVIAGAFARLRQWKQSHRLHLAMQLPANL